MLSPKPDLSPARRIFWFGAVCLGSLSWLRGDDDPAREMGIYLQQHGYGVMHVDVSGDHNDELVEAEVNGKTATFMIDTGCSHTAVRESVARDLGLDVHDSGHSDTALAGTVRVGIALVKSFKLEGYEINRTSTIEVIPETSHTLRGTDGLFGFDYLHANAVILPVGARILFFKPGATPVASIDHYMALLGLQPIPVQFVKGGLRIEGELNGHPLTVLVDCGAEYSSFDLTFTTAIAGLAITRTDMYGEGVDGNRLTNYAFTTKSLKLGALSVPPTEMMALTTPTFSKQGFNALLGYDFLASHEAIIDLGTDTLWMK